MQSLGFHRGADASFANPSCYTHHRTHTHPSRHTQCHRSRDAVWIRSKTKWLTARTVGRLESVRQRTPSRRSAAKVSEGNNSYDAAQSPRIQKEGYAQRRVGSNIPWGMRKIVEVMVLWLVAFVALRSTIWNIGMWLLGIASEAELSACGQAAFTLFLDVTMLYATFSIIGKTLEKFKPFRTKGIFPFSTKGKWWITVIFACLCIPIVDWLGTHMTVWFPEDIELPTNNVVVQLSKGDVVPNVLYFLLLSSLSKSLPRWVAILMSSAIFALMHGNLRQCLPLCVLGVIIGWTFVQTRNLLPAILLHSLYNCYVFAHVLFGT